MSEHQESEWIKYFSYQSWPPQYHEIGEALLTIAKRADVILPAGERAIVLNHLLHANRWIGRSVSQ